MNELKENLNVCTVKHIEVSDGTFYICNNCKTSWIMRWMPACYCPFCGSKIVKEGKENE